MATLILCVAALSPARADEAGLHDEIAELRAEVVALRTQVEELRRERVPPVVAPSIVATRDAAAPPDATIAAAPATAATTPAYPSGAAGETTTLWGYGELNYNRPTKDTSSTLADLRRGVLGFGHAFSGETRVLGELEWEHAVVSADDRGESEVEQLYVEHQFAPQVGMRAGLVLIPLGLLNEHHEPGNYYGVERNFVETAIIPSTWREGGLTAYGSTSQGLNWNVGVTTGFDLGKWDAASGDGRQSPLGSIHQELQLAKAHDLSAFAAASWVGLPGLTVGGGAFTGKVGQGQKDFPGQRARLTIGETHARWQPGRFDLSALYARAAISGTEALNLTFAGDSTPVPKSFWGGYVQGAWHAWQRRESAVTPFLRYEEFNTAASYEPLPPGLGVTATQTEHVWTSGINYWLTTGVVFKADYQIFKVDRARNRFDLGVGYQF